MEKSVEQNVFNAILSTPHGEIRDLLKDFLAYYDASPKFFAHFASWYYDNGKVRDFNVLFAVTLLNDTWFRDVGIGLIQRMSPREILRAVELENWRKTGKEGGHFYDVPRSLRTGIRDYLYARWQNHDWFYSSVVANRESMKKLTRGLRIPHSQLVQQVLFEDNPPEGSLPYLVKVLSNSTDEHEILSILVNNKIPWPIAVSVVKVKTPAVMVAMVASMTPAQMYNNLGALKKRGFLDDPNLKSFILDKIESGKTDKRMVAERARRAMDVVGIDDEEFIEATDNMMTENLKDQYEISRNTAILIDASGSMDESLEIGKRIVAETIAAMNPDANLYTYVFNNAALEFNVPENEKTILGVNNALKGVRAIGGTSYGVALDSMKRKGQVVEQIIFTGDDAENTAPYFQRAYNEYSRDLGVSPDVILVKIPGEYGNSVERACSELGVSLNKIQFSGDDYSIGHVLALMTKPSMAELIESIYEHPLATRMYSW